MHSCNLYHIQKEWFQEMATIEALVILAKYHGIAVNPQDLKHHYSGNSLIGMDYLLLAAKGIGLKAKASKKI